MALRATSACRGTGEQAYAGRRWWAGKHVDWTKLYWGPAEPTCSRRIILRCGLGSGESLELDSKQRPIGKTRALTPGRVLESCHDICRADWLRPIMLQVHRDSYAEMSSGYIYTSYILMYMPPDPDQPPQLQPHPMYPDICSQSRCARFPTLCSRAPPLHTYAPIAINRLMACPRDAAGSGRGAPAQAPRSQSRAG